MRRLHIILIVLAAAQWLAAILLATAKELYKRSAIRFVLSDLTYSAFYSAFWSTFYVLPIAIFALDSENPILVVFLMIFIPLMLFLIYLPSSLFPIDLLSRVIYGRPIMARIALPQVATTSEGALRIAHLTDLHLTDYLTLEADLSRSQVQEVVSRSFSWSMERADIIFFTGDITDQGRPEEWEQFIDAMSSQGYSLDDGRIFLVPGNHDLSLVTELQSAVSSSLSYDERAKAFIQNILMKCPRQWMMLSEVGRISVRSYLEDVADYLACYDEHPPYFTVMPVGGEVAEALGYPEQLLAAASNHKGSIWPSDRGRMCSDFLRMAYPMVLLDDDNYLVIGLNSCDYSSQSLLYSGFGRLGRKQIRRFEALTRDAGSRCVIVLLHHHVGIPPQVLTAMREKHRRVEIRALALRDAYRFARVLSTLDKCVVFHGHKHIGYQAMLGSAIIISGPSVAYGDELGGSNCSTYTINRDGKVNVVEGSPYKGL